jgi:hypothetical protein
MHVENRLPGKTQRASRPHPARLGGIAFLQIGKAVDQVGFGDRVEARVGLQEGLSFLKELR